MNIFTRALVLWAVVFATLTIHYSGARAQEVDKQPIAGLAIRLVAPEGYEMKSPVLQPPSEGGWMETGSFKRIRGWQKPDDGPPLTRIRIKSNYEGQETVRISVVAVFDDSEDKDWPGPKYGEKEKKIASYLARKGDTIKVTELEAYGVEPLALQLVPIKYVMDGPVAGPIEVKLSNPLKGVEVVSFNQSGDRPDEYQITLRNLTEKNIIALQLDQPDNGGGGGSSQSSEAPYDRALIAPQDTYRDQIYIQPVRSQQKTAGSDTPDPITLVVGTVVYADGSSEGDSKRAAQIITQREGHRAQLIRAVKIIRTFLGNPGGDEAETLRKIRRAIASLRIDAEDDLVAETLEKFPVLREGEARKNIAADLLRGLNNGRSELLYRIDEYEKLRKSNSSSVRVSTREWLEQLVSGYEATLGSAPH